MTLDIITLILADPGFAHGYLGETINVLVNGAPL